MNDYDDYDDQDGDNEDNEERYITGDKDHRRKRRNNQTKKKTKGETIEEAALKMQVGGGT